jgi:MscS family membrane protein
LNCKTFGGKIYSLAIVTGLLICAGPTSHLEAQRKKPESPPAAKPKDKAEPAAPLDPLGRETPRSSMMGFLSSENRGDYATAALYLQTPAGQSASVERQLKQLRALHQNFNGDLALLSDDPNGSLDRGLPPGEVRAGKFQVGDATSDVILVRVDDPTAGKIWLMSNESVAGAEALFKIKEKEQPSLIDRILPDALTKTEFLGMTLARWLGWLLSVPVSWLLAWPVVYVLNAPILIARKIGKRQLKPVWETPVGKPLRYIVAILIDTLSVYVLDPPLIYRVYYFRLMAALLAGCFIWLLARLTDRGLDRALSRARTQRTGTESILMLTQRVLRIVLLLVAIVAALAVAGFNMRTALAGLGIGGLAIALAAQKTLENVLGGISLLMDKAVNVGDQCRIGDRVGIVEDIGLRSVKVRTREQTLLVVPNGTLAQMQFGNLATRRKCLINQHFSLRIETEPAQLRLVLDGIQTMLDQHPAIEPATSRARVSNFAGASFEIELWAYGTTGDWAKFTVIQQDVILKVADIVAVSGARFAIPQFETMSSPERNIYSRFQSPDAPGVAFVNSERPAGGAQPAREIELDIG